MRWPMQKAYQKKKGSRKYLVIKSQNGTDWDNSLKKEIISRIKRDKPINKNVTELNKANECGNEVICGNHSENKVHRMED